MQISVVCRLNHTEQTVFGWKQISTRVNFVLIRNINKIICDSIGCVVFEKNKKYILFIMNTQETIKSYTQGVTHRQLALRRTKDTGGTFGEDTFSRVNICASEPREQQIIHLLWTFLIVKQIAVGIIMYVYFCFLVVSVRFPVYIFTGVEKLIFSPLFYHNVKTSQTNSRVVSTLLEHFHV